MSKITLKVNGSTHSLDIDPSTPLLYILRNDLGLQGPRFGCGLGQCGACTVIINGAAVRSCVTPCSRRARPCCCGSWAPLLARRISREYPKPTRRSPNEGVSELAACGPAWRVRQAVQAARQFP